MSLRVDVVSIFPAYLDALRLSLPGKAIRDGLLDLHVHDLRDWTHDRHRTVDDVPYGGGAGMVMRPEPWGEALDALVPGTPSDSVLVVPTPSGRLFTQALAHDLATAHHLVVACGRYEGIDQRVLDHAATRMRVVEVSIGDYVLNGGEAAALVILEATVRLLPGFLGNPDSLTEESHDPATGLLEYPVYTRPESWRGLDVPAVLRGGDHAAIAAWRHAQALRRTADRRPDLAHPARAVTADDLPRLVKAATPADAGEILTLQRACWLSEQQDNPGVPIPALHESLEEVRDWLTEWTTLVVRVEGRLVAAGRARRQGTTWDIGRLMVAPDLQGTGLGRAMLAALEEAAPDDVTGYTLFTGEGSLRNQRIYRRAGYRPWPDPDGEPGTVRLSKRPSKRRR